MIDAGRQRLNPLQPRRAGEHEILHLDAEHDHDVDIAQIARDFAFVVEQLKLQRGKFFAQRIAIHFGVNVDDENFGHACGRPRYLAALPKAMSWRSGSASGDVIEKLARLLRRLEGIIGGEHHAVLAERGERAVERLGRAHARRRHHDILLDVLRRRLGELDAVELRPAVEAPEQERQRLAEMAEHQLGAREAVEQAAEHQPQGVRAGLKSPFPGGAAQAGDAFEHRGRGDRIGRMNIDRRAERLGALPERIERRMVEILAVGVAVDHGAAEFQLAHAALELVGGAARVLHRQMRKAGIAVRPLLDFAREKVVGLPRDARRGGDVALDLHAGAGDGQHRARDAGLVHRLQALLAEIGQARQQIGGVLRIDIADGRAPIGLVSGRQKMLFQRNFLHHAFLDRFLPPRLDPGCRGRVYNRYPVQWYTAQCYKRGNAWAC